MVEPGATIGSSRLVWLNTLLASARNSSRCFSSHVPFGVPRTSGPRRHGIDLPYRGARGEPHNATIVRQNPTGRRTCALAAHIEAGRGENCLQGQKRVPRLRGSFVFVALENVFQ